jgi:hypothetical protein
MVAARRPGNGTFLPKSPLRRKSIGWNSGGKSADLVGSISEKSVKLTIDAGWR